MEKVERNNTPRDWLTEADKLEDVDQLRVLWATARQAGADKDILTKLEAKARGLDDSKGERS
jgi:hypothetical protein